MRCERGLLTYNYKIHVDLSEIADKIIDKIGHADDWSWEADTDELVISVKHTTGYQRWRCNATLESPAEDELELHDCVIDDVDPKVEILNALHEMNSIRAEIEIEDYNFGDDD